MLSNKYIICFEPVREQDHFIGKWIINNDRGDYIRTSDKLHELFQGTNCEIIDSVELRLGSIKSRAILSTSMKVEN